MNWREQFDNMRAVIRPDMIRIVDMEESVYERQVEGARHFGLETYEDGWIAPMHVAQGLYSEFAIDGPEFGYSFDGSEHFGLKTASKLRIV
jgi:hypothetical protein